MIAVKIDISDQASPVVRAVGRAVRSAGLNAIIGRTATNAFREHLFGVDRSRPNALGGTRTHFYADAARGTHYDVLPDGVLISINQIGIRQRIVGGTIKPKKAKFLTIPVHPAAHGKRASEFGELEVIFDHNGRPVALARPGNRAVRITQTATGKIRKASIGRRGEILFALRRSVTQAPDPSVLPYRELLAGRIARDVGNYVQRIAGRSAPSS